MTTIDHQQAAKSAAAEKIIDAVTAFVRDHKPISGGQVTKEALTAAAPHLRAAWEQELARAVKRLPWNGVTHGGTMVPLDAVLALLEGGAE